MDYYKRALELKDETIAHRRYLHTNAEVGLDLPKTRAYVIQQLEAAGIKAERCGYGVTAMLGKDSGKVILLRGDMDALPMPEESGEPFACPTGLADHACGHDFHASMLLTAAKMLKENESALNGRVKLMFQPAEETFEGGRDMIEHGILENPEVDAALAYHVTSGHMPIGFFMYNSTGTMMFSVDGFRIRVYGKGSHGAYPQSGIDPINIAVHIYLGLESIIAREVDAGKSCVMTIGKFTAGTANNIIPDECIMEGSIRCNDPNERKLMVRRMKEVAKKTAEVYGGSAEIDILSHVSPLICNPELTEELVGYMMNMGIPGMLPYAGVSANASEDFASVAERVPSTFIYLSAGFADERGDYDAHNPKVRFNEDVCPVGSSCLAHCATEWLKNNG